MKYISKLYVICIFIRFAFIYGAYWCIKNNKYYTLFTWFYFALGCGSLYFWITNSRKKGGFNQTIWWQYLRPIHGVLYILTAYFIYQKNMLFIPTLLIDSMFSIYGHIQYHYT